MASPGAARQGPPLLGLLSALGLEHVQLAGMVGEHAAALATYSDSDTFRWLRRWAVVAVVAIVTPITVITAYADQMPEFHHVAVPLAVAIIVPAWVLELTGVRFPRLVLIAATVLPNVWLTLIGHDVANYLWLLVLVAWIGMCGTLAEGATAFALASATIALDVLLTPAERRSWTPWLEWTVAFLLTWFMGLVLRRQVTLVAELRLLRVSRSSGRAR